MFSCSKNAQITFKEKPQLKKKISFDNYKQWDLIHNYYQTKLYKSPFVTGALYQVCVESRLKLRLKSLKL